MRGKSCLLLSFLGLPNSDANPIDTDFDQNEELERLERFRRDDTTTSGTTRSTQSTTSTVFSDIETIQIDDTIIEYFRIPGLRGRDDAAQCVFPGIPAGLFNLPVPSNQRENDFYLSLLDPVADADSKGRSRYWLGITKVAGQDWVRDDGGDDLSFTNWNIGEGVDDRPFSVASAMLKTTGEWLGEWVDIPSDDREYVGICTKTTKTFKFPSGAGFATTQIDGETVEYHYAGGEQKMTFTDARAYCNGLSASLAVPDNMAMNTFFASLIDEFTPMERYWVGISGSTGPWLRDDGHDLDFEFWQTDSARMIDEFGFEFQRNFGDTGDVVVSTTTSLNYPHGPWTGQWEDFVDDGSLKSHVICRIVPEKENEVTATTTLITATLTQGTGTTTEGTTLAFTGTGTHTTTSTTTTTTTTDEPPPTTKPDTTTEGTTLVQTSSTATTTEGETGPVNGVNSDAIHCPNNAFNVNWKLVRRTNTNVFPVTDNLSCDPTVWGGSYSSDPLIDTTFTVPCDFIVPNFDQFMFTTGDCSKWMIMDREFAQIPITARFSITTGVESLPIIASHLGTEPRCVKMRYDASLLSDPVLSFDNFNPDAPFASALYVEGGVENNDNSFATENGGLNVFVRKQGTARNGIDCESTTTTTTTKEDTTTEGTTRLETTSTTEGTTLPDTTSTTTTTTQPPTTSTIATTSTDTTIATSSTEATTIISTGPNPFLGIWRSDDGQSITVDDAGTVTFFDGTDNFVVQATFALNGALQTVSFTDANGRLVTGVLTDDETVTFDNGTWVKDNIVTTTPVAVTTTADDGLGSIIGDPHVKIQIPGEEPICFDIHSVGFSSKFNLIHDEQHGIRVDGKVETDKHLKNRLTTVYLGTRAGTALEVNADYIVVQGERYEFTDDKTFEMDDVKIILTSLNLSRLKGVLLEFKSGARMHIAAKDQKESLKFEVTNSRGLSNNLSGLIGHSIRPNDYHIDEINGVIKVEGRTITNFKRTWIDHSYCYSLAGEDVFNFLGKKLEDFVVLDVQLIEESNPK